MLIQIIIGAVAMLAFMLLIDNFNKKSIKLNWWEWTLTVLGFIYAISVVEVIVLFLAEGLPSGAAFMGGIMAIIAVIWAVLVGRYVIAPKSA